MIIFDTSRQIKELMQEFINLQKECLAQINFYGDVSINSGVQLMKLVIQNLRLREKTVHDKYFYFNGDPYRGNENWRMYESNYNLLPVLQGNNYMRNVETCGSKQIFVKIQ